MTLGKSIRIYLADGSVTGVRHGEIVNWTGQAIACPRSRFQELKGWSEVKRPGVYFLFGQNEESGQDAVYIGEAEVVLDRLYSHMNEKQFWTELVVFTSKDDNLTKGHVRYLESRLIELANAASRYQIENSASPQLPVLPRADRDAMEEFISSVRTLLGILGHRVLESLVYLPTEVRMADVAQVQASIQEILDQSETTASANLQTFQLRVSNLVASAVRTDEGLVVLANSEAAKTIQSSLSESNRTLREHLLSIGVLADNGQKLKFVRDQLFRSPSQAAAIVVGYSINGRHTWRTPAGATYSDYEAAIAKSTYSSISS